MSAGKRFKFHGSTIAVSTGFAGTQAITGITNANPAEVTAVGHTFAEGDVVQITGVVGMTEVNDVVYVVGTVDEDTFELIDVDSAGYGAYTSGGIAKKATMSNFCELTGYNRSGGSSPEIEGTTICSTAAEFEIGLPDYGTTQLDFNFAPRTVIQKAMKALHKSGEAMVVKIVLPKNGGEMIQLGFVQQTNESASNGGLWTASATIRNTGERIDIEA